jgi:hypothetical protein
VNRIEERDAGTLEEFLSARSAVLTLATTTCENCALWTTELGAARDTGDVFPDTRFGKLSLDRPGLVSETLRSATPTRPGG